MPTLIKMQWTLLWRTQRLLILLGLGAFLGLLSAITARYMPEILAFVLASEGLDQIPLPEATVLEAYAQLIGNLSQLFMMVLLFIFASYVHYERRSQFAETYYTLPFTETDHVFAKTLVMFLVIGASLYFSALWFGSYTQLLFGEMAWGRLLIAMLPMWALAYLFYALTLLCYTFTKRFSLTLILTFVFYFVLLTLMMFEGESFAYFPQALFQAPMALLTEQRSIQSVLGLSFLYLVISDSLVLISLKFTKLGP